MIVNSLKHQNITLLHKMLSQNFYSCESVPLGNACDGKELVSLGNGDDFCFHFLEAEG